MTESEETTDEVTGLTARQTAFVQHYAACLNGAKAARLAGYGEAGARQEACRLLSNADIRAAVDQALQAAGAMPASEVLSRLTAQARASLGDLLTESGRGARLDMKKAMETGAIDQVKKYTKGPDGGVSVELYDGQRALELLGKYHRLFTENVNVSGDLSVKGYATRDATPDAWDEPAPPVE